MFGTGEGGHKGEDPATQNRHVPEKTAKLIFSQLLINVNTGLVFYIFRNYKKISSGSHQNQPEKAPEEVAIDRD